MANVPKTDTTGITQSEGLLGQLFNYLQSMGGGGVAAPTATPTTMPGQKGLLQTMYSLRNKPMTAMAGGGVDPGGGSSTYTSGIQLGSNPARAGIRGDVRQAMLGNYGQNLNLQANNLFQNQSMQQIIESLMSGISGSLGQMGNYPPNIRGLAHSTAAAGTGGGMNIGGMFGF
jgi:hypothetical protein